MLQYFVVLGKEVGSVALREVYATCTLFISLNPKARSVCGKPLVYQVHIASQQLRSWSIRTQQRAFDWYFANSKENVI